MVQYIVDDSGASLLLVDAELDERFAAVRAPRRIVLDGEQDAELFAPSDSGLEWPALDETAPATINYTSGTTGMPKGVVLTQRSHWLNAVAVGWGFGLGASRPVPAHAADLPRQRMGSAARRTRRSASPT